MSTQSAFKFSLTTGGGLQVLVQDGTRYSPVACIPLFPLSDPDNYIAVMHETVTGQRNQIGIINHLHDLEPSQRMLVKKDIKFRFFIPEIRQIYGIKSRRRVDIWTVLTDRGKTTFTIKNRQENMLRIPGGGLLLTDKQNCRYKISKRDSLDRHSQKELIRLI